MNHCKDKKPSRPEIQDILSRMKSRFINEGDSDNDDSLKEENNMVTTSVVENSKEDLPVEKSPDDEIAELMHKLNGQVDEELVASIASTKKMYENQVEVDSTSVISNNSEETDQEKPRIILTLRPNENKPDTYVSSSSLTDYSSTSPKGTKPVDKIKTLVKAEIVPLKRSSRRSNCNNNQSVLNSAIARKEKKFSVEEKVKKRLPKKKIKIKKPVEVKNEVFPVDIEPEDIDINYDLQIKEEPGEEITTDQKRKKKKVFKGGRYNIFKKKSLHKGVFKKAICNQLNLDRTNFDLDSSETNSEKHSTSVCSDAGTLMSSDRNDQDDDMDTSSFSNIDVESISEDKTLDNIQDKVNLCLCNNHIEVILCDEGIVSCKAEDCVDGLLIKCKKLSFHIDDYGNMPMVRANVTLPFGSFCAFHMKRFFLHHSCPRCGRFCSEGIFMMCKNKHFSHIGCHQKEKGCLHCGVLDVYDVELKRRIVKPKKERCSTPSDIIVEIGNIKLSTICCPPQIDKAELSTYLQQLKDEISDSKRIMYSVSGLYQACESNNIPKVLSIIGSECNLMYRFTKISNRTALHAACANGNLMIIYLLLQAGVDPNVVDDKMKSPMRLAAKSGHSYAVQYLLEFNGAPEIKDLQGMTALHLAAKNGHFECCKVLSNKRPSMVNWKDKGGWTPLVWACENSHTEVVEHFITHKPNTRLPDEEHNVALHWAAISGCFDVVKCLVEYDPEVNMANDAGDTPLHIAARKNTFDIVSFLLENGAEASHKNKKNRQPIDCCFPNSKCYNLLKSYQQKISDKQSITPVNLQYTEPKLKIAQLPIVFKTTSVIVSEDISYGCEDVPIRCVNEIDDEQPVDFTYIKENCYDVGNHVDSAMSHIACCNCEGPCNTSNCKCVQTNGECLYDENGRLNSNFDYFNPSGIIYECNLRCRCHKQKCGNRVIQKGIKISLELFKHTDMGWGVRTRQAIPQGTFVCEYIGEIITDQKANDLKEDSYLFNLENPGADQLYCIDAYNYSNVSRFINHSCDPNLLSVRSFINHHDKRFPRIAFFATQNIAPNEQLYYDYGAAFWKIKGELFTCKCGKPNCSFSLETIQCLRIDSDDDNDDVNNDDYNDDNDVNDDYNDDYNDDNDVNDDYNDDNDVNDDYNDGDNGNDDDNDNKEEEETPIQIQSNKPKDKPSTVTLSNQNMLKKNEIICTKSLHEYTKMSSINSSVTTKYNTQKNNNSKNPNVISMPNNGLRAKNNDEDKHSKPLLGSHSTLNSKLIQDKLQNVIVNRKRIDQRILNRNVNASVRKKMLINNSKLSKSVEITDNKVLDSCLLRPKVLNSKKKIKLNNSTFQNDTILKTDDIKNNRKIISLDVSNRDQDTIEVLNDSNQMIDLINNELTDEESETELNMGNKESVDIPKNSYTSKGEYGKVLGIKTNFEKEHFLNNKNGHQLNRSMTFFERNNININSH